MGEKAKKEKRDIVIAENRAFEGVWIPKRLYITNKFNLRTKFFVVEIKSLSKKGYCYATDKHFAEFLGVSERMVQIMIKQLKDDGYLTAEYEYEKDTKGIRRRFLILTQKFLDEFYNEEEFKHTEKNFNTPTEKDFGKSNEINFNTGTEKKYGEKYNNKINDNNNLSNTNSSITKEAETLSKDNAGADTNFSKKSLPVPEKKKTKSELKELETKMIKRFYAIGNQYDISKTALKNIVSAFVGYIDKYTERTGKIHPILKDETLEKIFVTLATISDTEYNHFENVANYEPDSNGISYLDEMVDEHFNSRHSDSTDWHISHFAKSEYLEKMAQHIVDW